MRSSTIHGRLMTVILMVLALSLAVAMAASANTDLGTSDNPVQLSLSASYEEIEVLASALEIATGLHFDVNLAGQGQDAVDWLCSSHPDSGMGVISGVLYVVADERCGAETNLKLVSYGSGTQQSQFVVPNDSDLDGLADLAGLDWYYPAMDSPPGYIVPLGMLTMAGVEGYNPIQAPPHPKNPHAGAVQAVYDNAVSDPPEPTPVFATVFVDARNALSGLNPSVFETVRVLKESPPYPHTVLVFGPEFPAKQRDQIEEAIVGFSDPEHAAHWVWEGSIGVGGRTTGLEKIAREEFKFLEAAVEASGLFDWGDA
jgi:ABC-type phosphate/phosphonate transport system substrate-binding protein